MKIGAFAKKFNTTKSKVRYYTEILLLMPNLEGTYPDYDEQCEEDMNEILLFKSYGFSNNEILNIKSIERFSKNDHDVFHRQMKKIIGGKINEHKKVIHDATEKIKLLEAHDFESKYNHHMNHVDFSFNVLSDVKCACGQPYRLTQADIAYNMISSAHLSCCDQFKIEQGVLMRMDHHIQNYNKQAIHHDFKYVNNEHFALFHQCKSYLKTFLESIDHSDGIMILSPSASLFLMDFTELTKEDGKYVFVFYDDLERYIVKSILAIREIKGNIGFVMYSKDMPIRYTGYHVIDYNCHQSSNIIHHTVDVGLFSNWLGFYLVDDKNNLSNLDSLMKEKRFITDKSIIKSNHTKENTIAFDYRLYKKDVNR